MRDSLFDLLVYPLPTALLPWLYTARGLGLWVLPKDEEHARRIVHERIGIRYRRFRDGDKRKVAETAHYDTQRKLIILPYTSLLQVHENIAIHEVGHAVDCLYYTSGHMLSSFVETKAAIAPSKPLNDYCRRKDKETGTAMEQFATAFSAYFQEPEGSGGPVNIQNLSQKAIDFFRTYIVAPFEEINNGKLRKAD